MSDPEINERAKALVAANPGTGILHLTGLALELSADGVAFDEALRIVTWFHTHPRGIVRQVDVLTGNPWRDDPALVPVRVALTEDLVVEVELVPSPHVRMLVWTEEIDQARRPETAGALAALEDEATRAVVAELAVVTHRWEIGVPFAAATVMLAAASASASISSATLLRELTAEASAAARAEVRSLPLDLLRSTDDLRSEVVAWRDAIAQWRPDLEGAWTDLVNQLPAGWDEAERAVLSGERELQGAHLGGDGVETAGLADDWAGTVPVHNLPPVSLLGLFDRRVHALVVRAVDGAQSVRIPVRATVQERWRSYTAAFTRAADPGVADPLGAEIHAELAWWRLRAEAVVGEHVPPDPDAETQVSRLLPPLSLVLPDSDDEIDDVPLRVTDDGSAFVSRLPDDLEVTQLVLASAWEPDLDGGALLDGAQRLAEISAWAEAADAFEAAVAVLDGLDPIPGTDDQDPGSIQATGRSVLAAMRAAMCWRQVAASSPADGFTERADALEARARAALPGVAETLAAVEDQAFEQGRPVQELVRLRPLAVQRLEQIIEADRDGDALLDAREAGQRLLAIDRALSGWPRGARLAATS